MAVLDILGDGSCLAHYVLEEDVNDTGGIYNGTSVGVTFVNDAEKGLVGNFNGSAYVRGPSKGVGIPIDNNLVKTVTCWFYANSSRVRYNVWSSGKSANGKAYSLLGITDGGELQDHYTTQYTYTSKLKTIPYNTWNFCAVAGDKVFLGDELVGTISAPIGSTSNTYGFYIGGNGAYDYGYMDATYGQPIIGMISDLRIFTKVLSEKEVGFLKGAASLPKPPPTPIILSTMPATLSSGFSSGVLG